jgi:transcriptional regulator with XRE-family HTH domain
MDVRQRVGQNLKRLRRETGWSQEEFAFECGIHRTYISGLERGVRNPTITVLDKVAKALKVSPAVLLEDLPRQRKVR